MGGAARPGGCERCGQLVEVTYTGWQFMCKNCRAEFEREKAQEARRAHLLAEAERADRAAHAQAPGPWT